MKTFVTFFILSLALVLTSCGGQNGSNSPASGNNNNSGSAFNGVDLQGSGTIGNTSFQMITINPNSTPPSLVFSVPLPSVTLSGTISETFASLPGANLSVSQPSGSTSTEIQFTLPLSYLIRGIAYGANNTLPDGQNLPGINSTLPMYTATPSVNGQTVYLYGGKANGTSAFAVFYPTPNWNPDPINGGITTFTITGHSGSTMGYISLVGVDGTSPGGVYVALVISPALQSAINTLPTN